MPSNEVMLAATYAAFNKREIDAVLAMLHPNVDWPNRLEGGRLFGRGEVREYWLRQWGMIDPRVEPLRFEEDDTGRTVVHVHQVVRDLSGKVLLDQIVQHIYTIQGGLIERMDIPDTEATPTPGN
jgi:hypothetical protein